MIRAAAACSCGCGQWPLNGAIVYASCCCQQPRNGLLSSERKSPSHSSSIKHLCIPLLVVPWSVQTIVPSSHAINTLSRPPLAVAPLSDFLLVGEEVGCFTETKGGFLASRSCLLLGCCVRVDRFKLPGGRVGPKKRRNRDELRERGLVFTATRNAVALAGASATAMCAAMRGLARRW